MAIPTTMSDLFVAEGSNSPAGSEAVFPNNDDFLRATQAILRRSQAISASTIASSTNITIGGSTDGDIINISGTSTIESFGTIAAGIVRILKFTGAASVKHSSNILIGQSVKCAAGDVMAFVSEGGGVWRCIYRPQNQLCVLSGSGTYTSSGNLIQDGNIILCDFVSSNTTTACTLDGVAIRGLTGAAGIDNVIGSLTGAQRLKYNSANSCWIAIDQTYHFITTSLSSNVVLPVGHTNVYEFSAVSSLNLRIGTTASIRQKFRISSTSITSSNQVNIYLEPDGTACSANAAAYSAGVRRPTAAVSTQSTTENALQLTTQGNSFSFDGTVSNTGASAFISSSTNYYCADGATYFEQGGITSSGQSSSAAFTKLGNIIPNSGTITGSLTVTRLN
jgi:hypothetical protein